MEACEKNLVVVKDHQEEQSLNLCLTVDHDDFDPCSRFIGITNNQALSATSFLQLPFCNLYSLESFQIGIVT